MNSTSPTSLNPRPGKRRPLSDLSRNIRSHSSQPLATLRLAREEENNPPTLSLLFRSIMRRSCKTPIVTARTVVGTAFAVRNECGGPISGYLPSVGTSTGSTWAFLDYCARRR